MKEVPPIKGSVPQIIEETMRYLRTVIIQQHIVKPKDREKSDKTFNYPYQALEEAVSNSLYHRDYRSREPIVIEIQLHEITISSATGPDRSISLDTIREGKRMVTRYYRNRRLGEFLKELGLTEGRSTGIPTIQNELAKNGSPVATFNTNEDRSYFVVTIPCHEGEYGIPSSMRTQAENDKENDNCDKELRQRNLSAQQLELVELIDTYPSITLNELSFRLNISVSALRNQRAQLEKKGIFLCREGATKKGTWKIRIE